MGERFATTIVIGGKVPLNIIQNDSDDEDNLIDKISCSEIFEDWNETLVSIESLEDLVSHVQADGYIHFYNPELSWGEFEDLEDFLQRKRIPYDKHVSPGGEYDGQIVFFRPNNEEPVILRQTDYNMNIVADNNDLNHLKEIAEQALISLLTKPENLYESLRTIVKDINHILSPVEELPKFEIVKEN